MSNTQRPTLQRKTTPKTEANRKAALDQGISLQVDGVTHTVRTGDLSSMDTMALRQATGMSFMQLMNTASTGGMDIDIVAALVWLSRRVKGERLLAFEDVAEEIGYDVDLEIVEDEPEDDNPEA